MLEISLDFDRVPEDLLGISLSYQKVGEEKGDILTHMPTCLVSTYWRLTVSCTTLSETQKDHEYTVLDKGDVCEPVNTKAYYNALEKLSLHPGRDPLC